MRVFHIGLEPVVDRLKPRHVHMSNFLFPLNNGLSSTLFIFRGAVVQKLRSLLPFPDPRKRAASVVTRRALSIPSSSFPTVYLRDTSEVAGMLVSTVVLQNGNGCRFPPLLSVKIEIIPRGTRRVDLRPDKPFKATQAGKNAFQQSNCTVLFVYSRPGPRVR